MCDNKGFGTWNFYPLWPAGTTSPSRAPLHLQSTSLQRSFFWKTPVGGSLKYGVLNVVSISQGIVINPVVRVHMDVSENSGTPKSSILIGCSIIKHPFRGTSIFGNTHITIQYTEFRPWHYYWNVGNPQNLKMPHAQGSEACPNMRCDEADDTSNINDRNPACLVQLHYCRK